jgi:hypothetical protein
MLGEFISSQNANPNLINEICVKEVGRNSDGELYIEDSERVRSNSWCSAKPTS